MLAMKIHSRAKGVSTSIVHHFSQQQRFFGIQCTTGGSPSFNPSMLLLLLRREIGAARLLVEAA